MCGIFGAVAKKPIADVVVEGLRRLEYRGYDSAGLAIIDQNSLRRVRAVGKVSTLADLVRSETTTTDIAIGHTRWATHGAPTEMNSHPHMAPGVAVVHNGIIENHQQLRSNLERGGCPFQSETDTEVIPWLLSNDIQAGRSVGNAMRRLSTSLSGSYAIAVLAENEPHTIHAKRRGSPLVAAIGRDGGFIASDVTALAGVAREAVLLDDDDQVEVCCDTLTIKDGQGRLANRRSVPVATKTEELDLGIYRHFMLKEIHQQSDVARTIVDVYRHAPPAALSDLQFGNVTRIRMIACGTSYYACMVAKRWFAKVAAIPVDIEIASEFWHAPLITEPGELAILVSQSGETADTLAALHRLKEADVLTIGLVNQQVSTLARDATYCLPLLAGPEIGVASTKALMAALLVLANLVANAAKARGRAVPAAELTERLRSVPDLIAETLKCEPQIVALAGQFEAARHAIVVGRGNLYPLALEGALKLKETSYIHAEGFAAGELKHGPIALIEKDTLIIALALSGDGFVKTASNIREIAARGGQIIVIGDAAAVCHLADVASLALIVPACDDLIQPMIALIPLQLLAYHAALVRGCDIDRPRNLAKSVTVE